MTHDTRRNLIKARVINAGVGPFVRAIEATLDEYIDQGRGVDEEAECVLKIALYTLVTMAFETDQLVLLDTALLKLVGEKDLTLSHRFTASDIAPIPFPA